MSETEKNQNPSIYADYIQLTKQYAEKYGEKSIVLLQVGAFFEVYGFRCPISNDIQDSKIEDFSQICNLNISEKKIVFESRQVLMAGFRDYTLDKYIQKIVDYGYTCIVYVQEKQGKTITRVLDAVHSPGTYVSYDTEKIEKTSNNIMCIWLETFKAIKKTPLKKEDIVCGIAVANIFTGKSTFAEFQQAFEMSPGTFDELERCVSIYTPSEVIIVSDFSESEVNSILQFSGIGSQQSIHKISTKISEKAKKCAQQKYTQHILETFFVKEIHHTCSEFTTYPIATQAFCFLLDFIQSHNPNLVKKITIPDFHESDRVILANHTLKQLNILSSDQTTGKYKSVASFLNKTSTAMGSRLFHSQIVSPTTNEKWLETEYKMTGLLLNQYEMVAPLRKSLTKIRDVEKINRHIVLRKLYPSTISQLYDSILQAQQIGVCFEESTEILEYLVPKDIKLRDLCTQILLFLDNHFYIDRCKTISSFSNIGESFIKPEISIHLDQAVAAHSANIDAFNKIHSYLNELIKKESKGFDNTEYVKIHETEKSGNTLQITKKRALLLKSILAKTQQIEISGTNIKLGSKDVKFVSASGSSDTIEFPELNRLSRDILFQKENLSKLLIVAFDGVLSDIEAKWYASIEAVAEFVARIDILQCKAYIAKEYNYCCPEIDNSKEKAFVSATQLRHALIEHIQQNETFIPNDINLGQDNPDGILLYGTNAVGKTSLIRAIGIAIIMAQAGFFVPCSAFKYKPYSAIFSRIIGNDNLFKGLSTFAVEMSELRIILKMSDKNSLILGDELCSGTETESALSIFVAGLQHFYKKQTSFIFATHFHEILHYEEIKYMKKIAIMHMAVVYDREIDALIYDRKLCDGPGNRMYGIEVCKSLHLSEEFLESAHSIRSKYFSKSELSHNTSKYNASKIKGMCEICKVELGAEIHHLEPQKKADENGFIGTFHKNHLGNLVTVCSKCHDEFHTKDNAKTLIKRKTIAGYQ